MSEFGPLQEKYRISYERLTDNGNTPFQCLDWNDSDLTLKSDGLIDLEFLLVSCQDVPFFLNYNDDDPEAFAYR